MVNDNLTFLEHTPTAQAVTVIGIPLDVGKDNFGTEHGADYMRSQGLLKMLERIGVSYKDLGNLTCPDRATVAMGDKQAKYAEAIGGLAQQVGALVKKEIQSGNKIIALGGDHSISIGTVSGAARAIPGDIGLVYIDAHPDAMTHLNSISGNVHGMVTTALLGHGHPAIVNTLGSDPKIKNENIIFIGLKDLDQGEIDFIREQKLTAITPLDIEVNGLKIVTEAIATLSNRVKNIWVSFDLDSLDSQFAPATPMSSAGGLTYREIYTISKYLGKLANIVGIDIVECLPSADIEHKTAAMAITVTANLLGAEYSWYTNYMEQEANKQAERSAVIDKN